MEPSRHSVFIHVGLCTLVPSGINLDRITEGGTSWKPKEQSGLAF